MTRLLFRLLGHVNIYLLPAFSLFLWQMIKLTHSFIRTDKTKQQANCSKDIDWDVKKLHRS